MRNISPFDRPLNIGEIIDRSFRLYRKNPGLLLMTVAVLLIPTGIVNTLVNGSALLTNLQMVGGPFLDAPASAAVVIPQFLSGLWSIVAALLSFVAMLAVTYQAIGLLHGKTPSTGTSLKHAMSRIWAYIGLVLLQGIVLFLVILAGTILVFIGMMSANEIVSIFMMVLFGIIVFGAVLFFFARWAVAMPAMIDQELGPVEALSYSWSVTKSHVWRTILFSILMGLLSMVVLVLPASLMTLFSLAFIDTPVIFVTIIGSIEQIFNIIWMPLQLIATVIFYFDLRVRNEGYDIAMRVEQFEADTKQALPVNAY